MTAKISELASPTLPLTGTELIEMSQSGTSVQVTYDELTGGILSFDGTTLTVLGDIVVNDITINSETLYFGPGDGSISVVSDVMHLHPTNEIVEIGQPEINSREGQLHLRGDDSDGGGWVQLYLGAGVNDTITYYQMRAREDLWIGPNTDADSLKYEQSTDIWHFTAGQLTLGSTSSNVEASVLRMHGDGTLLPGADSTAGASIELHTSNAYDTSISFFGLNVNEDDLSIGPDTFPDALKYDGSIDSWIFDLTGGNGFVQFSVQGSGDEGRIHLMGDDSDGGGEIRLYLGDAGVGAITWYNIDADGDDFRIGPNTDLDSLKYDGATNTWNFTGTAGVNIGVDDTVQGLLNVYGAANSTDGGRIRVYSPVDSQDQDYYELIADGGPFTIRNAAEENIIAGASGGLVSVGHDASPVYLNGSTVVVSNGILHVGTDDVDPGIVHIFGDVSGTQGGRLLIYNSADYDDSTAINNYEIQVDEDDLLIGPDTDTDSLKYVGADDIWDFTTGKVKISNMPSGATQVAAGVGVGQLWRTASHSTLPDGVVMIGI